MQQEQAKTGALTVEWMGVPVEVGKASTLVFLTNFNYGWMRGAGIYLDILNKMGNFTCKLKDKRLEDAKPILFDLQFIDKVNL